MGVAAVLAVSVAACAKNPESIAPAYVSEMTYQNFTCQQLVQEQQRLNDAYAVAEAQQKKARSNDIAGVILLGLPVSSMSGDNIAPQIANLKGQQEAVRKAMIMKNCG
ncbi:hypothetical protein HTY61_04140 [Oricola thermophila]|uniref:Twin-arginine translocation pathway signal n=2 Tax=Oricola thermophila TaxID=2742145 RepID=A0A6N1VI80_9HYPH|nr:hypothetical protein HTY61_04140 [Oricola thermophila]